MKAILVIDMPEEYIGSVIDVKLYCKGETVHEKYVNKLKPMPRKLQENYMLFGEEVLWQKAVGYNRCIDEILGEEHE